VALPGAPFPSTPLPAGRLLRRGKVRDIYDAGTAGLVIVASDRISAFDVVLSPGIPGKGVVLTQLSNFWFDTLAGVAPHHLLAVERSAFPPPYNGLAELDGRACLVRRTATTVTSSSLRALPRNAAASAAHARTRAWGGSPASRHTSSTSRSSPYGWSAASTVSVTPSV